MRCCSGTVDLDIYNPAAGWLKLSGVSTVFLSVPARLLRAGLLMAPRPSYSMADSAAGLQFYVKKACPPCTLPSALYYEMVRGVLPIYVAVERQTGHT